MVPRLSSCVVSSLVANCCKMMKAFIDRCRARGKGYFPSGGEAEAEVYPPTLLVDLEAKLTTPTQIEDSPLPTCTLNKGIGLPTSQSTIACRHHGCHKVFSTTSNRNKHELSHRARGVTEAKTFKRQKREFVLYIPWQLARF